MKEDDLKTKNPWGKKFQMARNTASLESNRSKLEKEVRSFRKELSRENKIPKI